jgi:hypothetical protein
MLEKTEGAIKIDNPVKLTTRGTQDEEIQNKNTTPLCGNELHY